jgi:diguanylate cyclase (GGDEF)-like protein
LEKALLLEQLEIAHEKLQRHAQLDIMTGLLNREAFFVAVEEAKSNNPSAKSTMLIADIDNFKIINDTWGHLEGDQAILKVAEVIKNTAGPNAIVGRIGGEEFAVFIADETSQPATITAENIRRNVEAVEFYPVKNLRQTLTLSIGGAMAMNNGVTSDLVRRADRTLYRAKNDGRNCVQFEMAS